MRKRRKSKYTWMPTLGGTGTIGASAYGTSFFGATIDVQNVAGGPANLYVTPIVPDETFFPDQAAAAGSTLRDFTEGQDWLLKRIVGKLGISVIQIAGSVNDDHPRYFTIGAAFFVGRADDNNENVPDSTNLEIDPLGSQNIRQPWIWRRTWMLQDGSQAPTANQPQLPNTNTSLMSALDGPHIDSKSARRIRREERLWFVLNAYGSSAIGFQDDGEFANPGRLAFQLDYRCLGAMRRSTNKSTF